MNFQKNHTQKKILSPVKHDQHPETHSLDPWLLYKNKNFFRKKIFAVSFSSKLGYKLSNQIKLVIPLAVMSVSESPSNFIEIYTFIY